MRISDWRSDVCSSDLDGDYPGGINAGTDAIIAQLQAPPEVAEQRAMEAGAQQRESEEGGSIFPLIFWGAVLVFMVIPMFRGGRRGRRYRRGGLPIMIWGPGMGGWGGGSSGGGGGFRPEERRVGTGCVSECRSRGAAAYLKT